MTYLLDSNIIIYHLNGDDNATTFISVNRKHCAISRITYIEVLSFDFTSDEEKSVKDLLDSFVTIDTNREIAIQSIKNRKSKKIKVPDNIIASTAQVYDLSLVTKNINDFNSLDVNVLDIMKGEKD